jgi:hypothetical protein
LDAAFWSVDTLDAAHPMTTTVNQRPIYHSM